MVDITIVERVGDESPLLWRIQQADDVFEDDLLAEEIAKQHAYGRQMSGDGTDRQAFVTQAGEVLANHVDTQLLSRQSQIVDRVPEAAQVALVRRNRRPSQPAFDEEVVEISLDDGRRDLGAVRLNLLLSRDHSRIFSASIFLGTVALGPALFLLS